MKLIFKQFPDSTGVKLTNKAVGGEKMIKEFKESAKNIFEQAKKEGRLVENPCSKTLRSLALEEKDTIETAYGNLSTKSDPMSRAAMFTKNNIDSEFRDEELQLIKQAEELLKKEELISMDVSVGDGKDGITARLIVPKKYAHVAYSGRKLFSPTKTDTPNYQIIMFFDDKYPENKDKILPDKDVTIRVAFGDDSMVKFVRNSNYIGEWKKGVFAGEDWRAKQKKDAIFLHAGCRLDLIMGKDSKLHEKSSLFVALSANGKTSLTSKVIAEEPQEESWLVQDDGGIMTSDGAFKGFEAGGLFIKTDGLNPDERREELYSVLKPHAVLENVFINESNRIDFFDESITSNGRAVVERRDYMHSSKDINVKKINNIFLITRGNIIPAVSKLSEAQAAAFMVLGQSMESSAGDPTQAGKIKNVFFYDPFIAGNKEDHANLFYELLKGKGINCYLINTGGIGEGDFYLDISLTDTVNILRSVIREDISWVKSESTGMLVPGRINGVDEKKLHPDRVYDPKIFVEKQKELNTQRQEILDKYPGLNKEIKIHT